eukprot:49035-Eustigmatos_ZCMA.PRE.1
MDVVGSFVCVDRLQVHHMPDDMVLIGDAVAAEHVARHASDVERLAARVALHDRGDLHGGGAFVLHAAQTQAALQAQRDFSLHVGQLLLDQLVGRERAAELLAVQHVLAGTVPAVFRRAQRAPCDAVARRVQARERAFQAAHAGHQVLFRHEHFVQHDFTRDG